MRLMLALLFISILPIKALANQEDHLDKCYKDEYTDEGLASCISDEFKALEEFKNKMEERTFNIVSSKAYISKLIYGVGEDGEPIAVPKPSVDISSNKSLDYAKIVIEDKRSRKLLEKKISDAQLHKKRQQRLKDSLVKSKSLFKKYRQAECSRRADSIIGNDKSKAAVVFGACQYELTNIRIEHLKEAMRQSQ